MKPSGRQKWKKKITAGIAILLAIIMVLSLAAPFVTIYG